MPGQGLSKQETQKQKAPTKSRMTGLGYLHSMGGMAPGGGGGTLPPGKGGPPDDKGDDGSDEEQNEEDDTDEETVSVTSSSQVSARRVRPLKWNGGKENTKEGAGGPPEDPNEPSRGGSVADGRRGPWDTEVRGAGPDHLEGMGQWDLWDLLDQGDSRGEMDYPTLGAHLLPLGWGYPLYLMLI